MKVTKKTLIAEVVEKYPKVGDALMEDYGFHCVGCFASQMETIEDGASVHGMTEKELESMLKDINSQIEKIEAKKAGKKQK